MNEVTVPPVARHLSIAEGEAATGVTQFGKSRHMEQGEAARRRRGSVLLNDPAALSRPYAPPSPFPPFSPAPFVIRHSQHVPKIE